MCWQRRKTPAKFPDCKGKSQGNCILFDPTENHVKWCVEADQRGSACPNPVITTQTSSTRRKVDCPRHRTQIPKPDDPTPGPGNAGGGGSLGQSVIVGA
ncbi:uncharacterized protein BO80DRAFT_380796 [Aspergillus ibericus CBS 121593]|uniref:Uncharacterized protein n=1 Tax=Aspergillus ibericus CBS 121593 TaxID=1448316 RepID=A0A395H0R8_9EURO|nr:hypothetical protein BO80DRAFT_380796 [Aspergillus ibericus CBS 121593]RAL01432.1 hypothetical protein BO80DRAFT_380796 [Aspergillus ibericus CBS 121593]